ncbi:MAG: thymidine phosphorylase [Alphaproteobacteria bacterium]|nr:thymidine phosphorylase [Alphaproteobacteria bacterium]
MIPQEIIRKKRDGAELTGAEIKWFVDAMAREAIGAGKVAAFAMAVFFRGMTRPERVALTLAMAHSGQVLDWKGLSLPGPAVDKHSTGGVGDKVSLILAPIVAACGGFVPMISGRGLGHTGGTLDKLDAIPGYRSVPDIALFQRTVRDVGCAIIGQTADLAPADRRFYAIRDVTGTVESIDLITASILSKKLAAGLDALVMDVKFGNGAFMHALKDARALARSIVDVANDAGLRTSALLTDMNQVLGLTAGNALEVAECVEALVDPGRGEARLMAVTRALAAEMLTLTGLAATPAQAAAKVETALASGAAAERFARMVTALGGPADFVERWQRYLPPSPVQRPAVPARPGIVAAVETRAVGLAVLALGGGRKGREDQIDPRVGLTQVAGIGETVGADRPLAVVHAADEASAAAAIAALNEAYTIADRSAATDAAAGAAIVRERIGQSKRRPRHQAGAP